MNVALVNDMIWSADGMASLDQFEAEFKLLLSRFSQVTWA